MTHVNGWKRAVVAVAAALAGAAQAQAQGTSSSSTAAEGRPGSSSASGAGAMGAKKVDKGLEERVQKIHAANQAEIQMGQLAAQQAQSPEVKQYAEKLEQDHQQADQKLESAAREAGIPLEGKAFQDKQKDAMKDMNDLHGKNGADFDKAFMSMMVKDHEKDLKEVQKAQKDAEKDKHAQLATVLAATATGMQGHLDQAKRLKDTVGKGARAQGRRGQMGAPEGNGMGSGGTGSLGTGSPANGGSSSGSTTTPPASGASPGSSATPEQQGAGTGTRERGNR